MSVETTLTDQEARRICASLPSSAENANFAHRLAGTASLSSAQMVKLHEFAMANSGKVQEVQTFKKVVARMKEVKSATIDGITFKLLGDKSKFPASVSMSNGQERPSWVSFGRLLPDGTFLPTQGTADAHLSLLAKVEKKPSLLVSSQTVNAVPAPSSPAVPSADDKKAETIKKAKALQAAGFTNEQIKAILAVMS